MDESSKDLQPFGEEGDLSTADVEILSIEGGDPAEATETSAEPTGRGEPVAPVPGPEPGPAAVGESEQLRRELEELRDRSLRAMADFDNFRKRAEREREELRRYVLAGALGELLPVVDNLERAAAAQGSLEDLRQGVDMTLRQLQEALRRFGLREVPAVGHRFDPHVHEAVMREERPGILEPTVITELLRGYLLNDRVLRPAMVAVAVPPEADGAGPADGAPES